ncbi:hypothetical protein FSOLCH5_008673 [Fusarium solani]
MSLDVILIGSMSIGNGFIYVQFHPLVYTIKLQIEMNISSLIVKVARVTGDHSSYNNDYARDTELQPKFRSNIQVAGPSGNQTGLEATGQFFSSHNEAHNEARIEAGASGKPASKGITRTVQTRVTVTSKHCEEEDEDGSSQSSTRQLKRSSHV